ncbi:MAG: hypothetical protein K8T25_20655 [Planctomycetia bacterium]|nr:hypothetical protein [Planctomycetia bacterium]
MKPNTGFPILDDAINELTRVFGRSPGSRHWADGMSTHDSSATLTNSVWELSEAEYEDFCWHSVALGGPEESCLAAIRYFLPRVALDMSLRDSAPWLSEYLARLLNDHHWRSWPMAEIRAIEGWLAAWIQYWLSQDDWRLYLATRCAGLCGIDWNAFFHELRERDQGASAKWLARSIESEWISLLQTGWPNGWRGYWGQADPPREQVVKFIVLLLRKSSIGLLENAFFHERDPAAQSLLSAAQQHANDCIRYGHAKQNTPLATALASDKMAL